MARVYRINIEWDNDDRSRYEEYITRMTTGQLNAMYRLLADTPTSDISSFTIIPFRPSEFESTLREIEVSFITYTFPERSAHQKAEELYDETPRSRRRRQNPQG